jgi:hypothetical protein
LQDNYKVGFRLTSSPSYRAHATSVMRFEAGAFHRMDRFLLALIFLRRAKRKLVWHVGLMSLGVDRCAYRVNRSSGVDSREESFGQMAKLGATEGVLPIENSRSCVGKRLHNNRLWLCSREFTTLKGMIWASGAPNDSSRSLGPPCGPAHYPEERKRSHLPKQAISPPCIAT